MDSSRTRVENRFKVFVTTSIPSGFSLTTKRTTKKQFMIVVHKIISTSCSWRRIFSGGVRGVSALSVKMRSIRQTPPLLPNLIHPSAIFFFFSCVSVIIATNENKHQKRERESEITHPSEAHKYPDGWSY